MDELAFKCKQILKIPWGHNRLIISKIKDLTEAQFYIQETLNNNWSRDVLALQIKSNLYQRQGKSITNFKNTLTDPTANGNPV
ncbi:MAG: hypothetical protein ACD_79C00171G0001 [uncultured bacterium]|nr:MAG: hypothetical protein ACD_79C00171G0001 [uncultured bacterium]